MIQAIRNWHKGQIGLLAQPPFPFWLNKRVANFLLWVHGGDKPYWLLHISGRLFSSLCSYPVEAHRKIEDI
jgi:hypothetical protein